MLIASGLDSAFLGFVEDIVSGETRAVYSIPLCIDSLVADGMDEEEAREYFEFNTLGAFVGPGTPLFITPTSLLVAEELLKRGDGE
ncbi:MAG: hypothetical protein P8N94_02550 [Gammaproteobacteria bacterium]|nr:hypothetical protein [Gammaproteobacteria bacterium]